MKHTDRQGALEGGEAAGERCLQLRGEEDSQLCDDASCDQLVRGHIKGWVPHLDTCREWNEGVKAAEAPGPQQKPSNKPRKPT